MEGPGKKEMHFRPWGTYEVILADAGYKVKRLTIHPGKRLSLQKHKKREERWVVARGRGRAQIGEEELEIGLGDVLRVPLDTLHRLENTGDIDLTLIEVQMGEYLGEDDIERVSDDWGRD